MIRRAVTGVLLCALVGVLGGASHAADVVAGADSARIPMFGPPPDLSVERDLPAVVQERILHEQTRALRKLKTAAREKPSRANGCVASDFPGALGPPAPHVDARVLGRNVEVLVEFSRLPRSLQCRPWTLRVFVHGRPGELNPDSVFRVTAPRGRIVVNLPLNGHPPYNLDVYSESVFGRRGRTIKIALHCPGSGDRVRGCLRGLVGFSPPKPELTLRGVTLAQLRSLLDYTLQPYRKPPALRAAPVASHCSSLHVCVITLLDRSFPSSPFHVRYRISGQQVDGCWLGYHSGEFGTRPYEDAGGGPLTLAACVAWLR